LSQVILSFQLGFAVIPLIHFVSDRNKMGSFAIKKFTKILSWIVASIIVLLNAKLIIDEIASWMAESPNKSLIWFTVIPIVVGIGIVLLVITFLPIVKKLIIQAIRSPHRAPLLEGISKNPSFNKIAVAIDFSSVDRQIVQHVLSLASTESQILILHVEETAGAIIIGHEINDYESHSDLSQLKHYQDYFKAHGFKKTSIRLGFGNPKKSIPQLVHEFGAVLLIMGAHGHNLVKDIIFGTTVDTVRHRVNIPVFIIRGRD
jgi:manganese transport protein